MKTDRETGAPQFTDRDLRNLGTVIYDLAADHETETGTYAVGIDDLNLWLRTFARERGFKLKLEDIAEWAEKVGHWRSDDFGHDTQKLLEAESDALQKAIDHIQYLLKLIRGQGRVMPRDPWIGKPIGS